MKEEYRLGLQALVKKRAWFVIHWMNAHTSANRPGKRNRLACLIEGFLTVEAGGEWTDYLKSLESCGMPTAPTVMLRPSQLDCDFTINAELRGGKPYFEIHAIGERGVVLSYFNFLAQVGRANRVRLCPNCQRWFFARRKDSRLCSARCQTGAYRKTPKGRAKRAAYMRDYRTKTKRLWEAKQKGRKLKRGRKLHVDLKKGE